MLPCPAQEESSGWHMAHTCWWQGSLPLLYLASGGFCVALLLMRPCCGGGRRCWKAGNSMEVVFGAEPLSLTPPPFPLSEMLASFN